MKDTKYLVVIIVLCVGILFLFMDKCGSSRKVDELKGQAEEASRIAKVERLIKEEIIKEQEEEIEVLNATIEVKNTTIAKKERSIVGLDGQVTDLEDAFDKLDDKDAKIDNLTKQVEVWKGKFSLAQSIIVDKDEIIFSLNEKYNAQLKITIQYKGLYESTQHLVDIHTKQIKVLEAMNRRIRLTSGVKTGVVLGLAGLVIYGVLK